MRPPVPFCYLSNIRCVIVHVFFNIDKNRFIQDIFIHCIKGRGRMKFPKIIIMSSSVFDVINMIMA